MRDTASFVIAETAVDGARVRSDQSTIRVWIPSERDVARRERPPRRSLGRLAADLGIPLAANPVLRARFATREAAVPRIAWFFIGAVFAVGAAVALLAAGGGEQPSASTPAAAPAVIDVSSAGEPGPALPFTGELPADVAPVQTLNVVTTVEIQANYAAPESSYQRGREARTERPKHARRSQPNTAAPTPPAVAAPRGGRAIAEPVIDDNPYDAPSPTAPTVDDNPY
jgi:hypothetical protein